MNYLLRHWQLAAIAMLVTTLTTAVLGWNRALTAKGVALERARVADSTLAAVRPQLRRVDTLVVRDTIRIRHEVARLETLRDTVLARITDTVVVKEFVRQADSVVAACSELSRDCAAYRRFAAATIAALEQKLAVQPVTVARSCTTSNVLSAALGLGAGVLSQRIHFHH